MRIIKKGRITLADGQYRSHMEPAAKEQAEAVTFHMLRLYLQSTEKKLRAIVRAHSGDEENLPRDGRKTVRRL